MILPTLRKSSRRREFDAYDERLKSEIVEGWLFRGLTHRELDELVLGLDNAVSKGWQSMGILHFLGLKKEYNGIFSKITVSDALIIMAKDEQNFDDITSLLLLKNTNNQILKTLKGLKTEEAGELKVSLQSSSQDRKDRINRKSKRPVRTSVTSYTYKRNPDIVAEALFRADGNCENCGNRGPFIRASDGSVYLEVHHNIPLSSGGEDSLENVSALCPNCHRMAHFG
jgi:5-methylcytosine-specific restriction protein A